MLAFTSLLLSIFAKNLRFELDIVSSLRRHQTLATIFLYFGSFAKIFLFELTVFLKYQGPAHFTLTKMSIFSSFVGFLFLRNGKPKASVIVVLSYLHIVNFLLAVLFNQPTAAVFCLIPILQGAFFITSSKKIIIINTSVCLIHALHHIIKFSRIFRAILTEEQFQQIFIVMLAASLNLVLITYCCSVQRFMEATLVQFAESNYIKCEKLTKEMVQAVEAQDKFVFSLSHEIRNPLTSINGSIDYLLGTVKNFSSIKMLKTAKLSTEILLNLLNNILDAARLKIDRAEISSQDSKLEDIIKKVFVINSENFHTGDIFAEAFIDKNVPALLWIDPSRILQILLNLISNAVKFTPKGGKVHVYATWHSDNEIRDVLLAPTHHLNFDDYEKRKLQSLNGQATLLAGLLSLNTPRPSPNDSCAIDEFINEEEKNCLKNFKSIKDFKVRALQELNKCAEYGFEAGPWIIHCAQTLGVNGVAIPPKKGFLKIEVLDTGCGIPAENVPKLFEMFTQGYCSVASLQKGTGLGLWICKQLCQNMGGDITVYSQVNRGTRFVFYIPVQNNDPSKKRSEIRTGPVKALVVDDYAFNRDLHRLLLEREGVQVTLACDGEEAFETFKAKGEDYFDFIMTDVQMPVMDGFTSAKKMREWEEENGFKRVDIYFVTAEYFNEDIVMAQFRNHKKKDVWCLKKPVDVDRVKKIARKYKRS